MEWRRFSRILWPSVAGVAGGLLALVVYAVVALTILNRFVGEDDRSTTGIALGMLTTLGSVLAFVAGFCRASHIVGGWFDPIE